MVGCHTVCKQETSLEEFPCGLAVNIKRQSIMEERSGNLTKTKGQGLLLCFSLIPLKTVILYVIFKNHPRAVLQGSGPQPRQS